MKHPRSRDEIIGCGTRLYVLAADLFIRARGKWGAKGKSIPRELRKADPDFEGRFSESFRLLFERGDISG
jgi:hypothetical protein